MGCKTKTEKADYEIMRTDATLNRILVKKAKMQARGLQVTQTKKATIKGKPSFMSATRTSTFRGDPDCEAPSRQFKNNDRYTKRKTELDPWITSIAFHPEEPLVKE